MQSYMDSHKYIHTFMHTYNAIIKWILITYDFRYILVKVWHSWLPFQVSL